MPRELRVGMVGAGWAAGEHARSIREIGGARVVAVHDVDTDRAGALAAEVGAERLGSLDALLSSDLDALVVSTPSGLHAEAVVRGIEGGLAVFVEKPLTRTIEDADAVVAASGRPGAICAVGYQWRSALQQLRLADRIAGGRIASLLSQGIAQTQRRAWFADPALSGGLLFERVSHHIDLQRAIAGEVAAVSAARGAVSLTGDTPDGVESDDVITLTLQFRSGAIGIVQVLGTAAGYPATQATRVYTTETAWRLELDPVFAITREGDDASEPSAVEAPFRHQMRRFLDAIHTGDASAICCSAADAAGTVRVAAAAERALAQRAPVVLPDPSLRQGAS